MPPARTVRHVKGSITLELVIAFAVASLVLMSVILLTGGSDALAFERESAESAIAATLVNDAVHASSTPSSFATSSIEDRIPYYGVLAVRDLTPCLQSVSGAATSTGGVGDGMAFTVWISDAPEAQALGGDCETEPATSAWQRLRTSSSVSAGTATAVDALNQYEYLGLSAAPYFAVFTASGTAAVFQNNFALPEQPNALDAAFMAGQPYVFLAMASSSGQLAVVDARDPQSPLLVATTSLNGINPAGADPAAYRIRYDSGRVYITTRFIAGPQPELHVFDVRDPSHPVELGSASLETTVNGMVLRSGEAGGQMRTYLYAATTYDTRELAIYDVTDPAHLSAVPAASVDLPGAQDGDSIAIQGTTLFLGRASNTAGPELYAFDIRDPLHPVLTGSAEIVSKDITALVPQGSLLFLGATNDGASNRMLEVWDISNPARMMLISSVKNAGLSLGGVEYAKDQVFAVGATTLTVYAGN